ncbi:MAG: F0F1 ATP synthase subunit B [Lachnospiraceae bacterium]|jgi:F-type H+-transporting ATPase subunit b|nr:F0F1 ATP synthase subunit B [Lachnospiraceae bacterium]
MEGFILLSEATQVAETVTEEAGLVSFNAWIVIATICNLFIQMLLIKKFLFKRVQAVLDKRRELAEEDLRKAKVSREEADRLRVEYESNMEQAREKATQIIDLAQKNATQKSDEIIREASQEAVAMKARAEADIALERRKAVNEVKNEIGSMAMEIAGKVIEREVSEQDHARLIDEFIEKVGT